jgi:hypothetical protein
MAEEASGSHSRATIWASLIGSIGVIIAAWIGVSFGRSAGRDQRTDLQKEIAERDAVIGQQSIEIDRLNEAVGKLQEHIRQLQRGVATGQTTSTAAPPPPPPEMTPSLPRMDTQGVSIRLADCLATGTTVQCDLFVTSNTQDREVLLAVKQESGIRRTGICFSRGVDLAGNEFIASTVGLGNKVNEDNGQLETELVADVNTPARLEFVGVRPQGGKWSLLEVCGAAPKSFRVQFRNVVISQR